MSGEKRGHKRNFNITDVTYEHQGVQFQGRISDLSQGGFFIDTHSPLAEGSIIAFTLYLPGDVSETPVTGEGKVAWQRPMEGMGIRYTKLSVADLDRLKFLLPGK